MNIFYLKKRLLFLLAALLAAGWGIDRLRERGKTDPLFLFAEIQALSAGVKSETADLAKKYLFLLNRHEKIKELGQKNKELEMSLLLFKKLEEENKRLKKLLNFSLSRAFRLLPAQVTGTDLLSKNELLTINKGSRQGLKKRMGVLSPEGAVGWIFRTGPNSSQIITLLNPLSSLPAREKKSRITGLITAGPEGLLLFSYLDKEPSEGETALKKGSKIVTIKTEGFPAGIPVGTVESAKRLSKDQELRVYVRPAAPLRSLEEALAILSPEKHPAKETAGPKPLSAKQSESQ